MSFKGFSIFISGGHFAQHSVTILAILVEGHPRNISVKLFWNQAIGPGDVIWRNWWWMDEQMYWGMDDGEILITIAHLEHYVLRWANKWEFWNYFIRKCKLQLIQKVLWYQKNAYGVLHLIKFTNRETKENLRFMIYLFRNLETDISPWREWVRVASWVLL